MKHFSVLSVVLLGVIFSFSGCTGPVKNEMANKIISQPIWQLQWCADTGEVREYLAVKKGIIMLLEIEGAVSVKWESITEAELLGKGILVKELREKYEMRMRQRLERIEGSGGG